MSVPSIHGQCDIRQYGHLRRRLVCHDRPRHVLVGSEREQHGPTHGNGLHIARARPSVEGRAVTRDPRPTQRTWRTRHARQRPSQWSQGRRTTCPGRVELGS
eukprot:scaffold108024_cov31-Tisochrysis_lutea.AAC.3